MSETISWEAPQWLNKMYLEDVLKKYLQDDTVRLQGMELKPATAKGENYASVMTRIKVSYKTAGDSKIQTMPMIMKCSYENDPFVANIMNGYDVYNTEMKMYEQVLPKIAKILKQSGDNEKIFATTFKVDYERCSIIFEDLAATNYGLADRLKGLDKDHTLVVLKKLAKFHAAAAVLNERMDGALESFQRGLFNRHTRGLGCMFEHFTETCANFAKTCPDLGVYYYDKLMKLQSHVVEYGIKATSKWNEADFYTLCHGDLWINNMLMQYRNSKSSQQKLENLLFVDFQFSNWSSPAVDLYYFFNTSLEPELQMDVHFLAEMVQFYHSILSEMLKKFKYNGHVPTLHELWVQLEERKFLALITTLTNQAVATVDECDDADFHCLVDDTDRAKKFRLDCYRNKRHQNIIKQILPYFDRCGLLDVQ
ncbi:uncharacterized protein LOC101898797 [Musca domestica]|uniref:Uncharacterized protein LOC101898797 n=1 Tax=Musca domestica TaxID=7370 RepID=A0A1I8NE63_MUSDO|nr:uncharacterized protein LOC101898797 [Musca domestica]